VLFNDLNHSRCATLLQQLLAASPSLASTSTSSSSSGDVAASGVPQGCWVPSGWLDVVEPFVCYLLEVLRRFRQDDSWQQRKEGEWRLAVIASTAL
jgi:hypothetical protein